MKALFSFFFSYLHLPIFSLLFVRFLSIILNYSFADLVGNALMLLILHFFADLASNFGVGLLNEWRFVDGTF
jgi:hypothetical protein